MGRVHRLSLSVLVLLACCVSVAYAQTVDEIVAKNIQAKGGAEKLKSVQSMKLTGHLSARGAEAPFTVWSKRPNLARQETTLQGTSMVRGFDGTTAWIMAGTQAQEVVGPEAASTKEQAEFDSPLLDYKAKGNRIEFVGTETLQGATVYHLKLTTKSGQVQQYYLDAQTGLERETSVTMVDQGGQQMVVVSDLSDFRDVNGLKIPFAIKQSVNGSPLSQLTIEKAEFNVPLEDALFKMPKRP
jgi:outer membrane lipoprotein-sorting protein